MQGQALFAMVVCAVFLWGSGLTGCAPMLDGEPPHPVYSFPELDRDSNQLVTLEEFLALYRSAGPSDFRRIDSDNSGTIDPQEWKQFLDEHTHHESKYESQEFLPHMRGPVYDPTTPPFPN